MPKSCSHWKSEYDASPCDLCELEEKAARERAERLDELERALSNANAALEEERKESAAWHATATDKGASSRRAAAERDEWKVRAEKAEAAAEHMTEQYRGMSALRDALLERAEAAEARLATPAHRHVDGGHFDAPDDACVLCTVIR
ncbi:MAG: hypothetical protein KGI71_05740, partial [Patescibacteria group bacterium]|nr:hypothetical protein [Patescibacteria group bacterium]